jgi:phospholipid/cholesterol/gamma-HCH transport system substrate-binding protein
MMVGLFMIVGTLAMAYLALKVSGLTNYKSSSHYEVIADFDNIGGLKVRAPVSIAGVRIGEVGAIRLDPVTFRATVVLYLDNDENLPSDSSASIYTQGLLGANYVSLTPGYSDTNLKNGDKIASTSPALVLEKLIGQLIFSLKDSGSKKE